MEIYINSHCKENDFELFYEIFPSHLYFVRENSEGDVDSPGRDSFDFSLETLEAQQVYCFEGTLSEINNFSKTFYLRKVILTSNGYMEVILR